MALGDKTTTAMWSANHDRLLPCNRLRWRRSVWCRMRLVFGKGCTMTALVFWWAQVFLGPLSMIFLAWIGPGTRFRMLHEWSEKYEVVTD
jgi:hypothetical protein